MNENRLSGVAYSAEPDLTPYCPSRILMGLIIGVLVVTHIIVLIHSYDLFVIKQEIRENTEFLAPIRKAQACQKTSKTQAEFDECLTK